MNIEQLETIINEMSYDLNETFKKIELLKSKLQEIESRLQEHIKTFDAHKEPIRIPK